MFTGTPEELREKEEQARALAQKVAALLNEIGELGLGPAFGQITVPVADLHFIGDEWVAR
ncbi:hypothetical protein [Streptomyces sp. NPDC093589]|uniref:hypothetical protein n=1 Tax=Streptomyces sp. NPDC093589 TaxID=3366043 RepID=UPI00381EB143